MMAKTDDAPDAPDILEYEAMDALPIGTEVRGIKQDNTDIYALRGEMYDGALTWFVDGYGNYRTRALMTLGWGWRVHKLGTHEV